MAKRSVELERFAFGASGTLGRIRVLDEDRAELFEGFTIERPTWPWVIANRPSIAAIPEGRYEMTLGTFYRNTSDPSDDYAAYEIENVPGRSLIKIHRGNTARDIKGCVAIGSRVAFIGELPGVASSKTAYSNFMEAMGAAPAAIIQIREFRPEV